MVLTGLQQLLNIVVWLPKALIASFQVKYIIMRVVLSLITSYSTTFSTLNSNAGNVTILTCGPEGGVAKSILFNLADFLVLLMYT